MRIGLTTLCALVALGALALAAALPAARLPGDPLSSIPWLFLAASAFVLLRRAVVHARDDEKPAPPETNLRRYGAGIAAWIVVGLLWFAGPLPRIAECVVTLVMLFTVEFGIVGIRKARSAAAKSLVALVHFGAPLACVALWLTR